MADDDTIDPSSGIPTPPLSPTRRFRATDGSPDPGYLSPGARKEKLRVERFGSGEEFRDFFKAAYGPTIAVYRAIADEPDRVAALDRDLAELGRSFDQGGGAMEWEYLLLTARRAG